MQKQVRIKEQLWKELEALAKQRNTSVADAADWILRLKIDSMHLSDSSKKLVHTAEETAQEAKSILDVFNLGLETGKGIARFNAQQKELMTTIKAVAAQRGIKLD